MFRARFEELEHQFGPAIVRLVVAAAVFGVVFSSGVVYTLSLPRYYEARARLWVQPKMPSSFSNSQGDLYAPFYNSFTSPITTASEVMRSAAVAKEAHDALVKTGQLKNVPSIGEIRGRLRVSPVREADILEVSYADSQAEVTPAVVKAVVGSFLHIINLQNNGNTIQSREFLEEERAKAQQAYRKSRRALENYQNQQGTVNLTEQTTALLRQKSELESEVTGARAHLSEIRSKLAFLQKQTGVSADDAVSVETLANDEIIQELKHKIAAQEVKLVDFRARFQKDSPQLKRAVANLNHLQDSLSERIKALSDSGHSVAASVVSAKIPSDGPINKSMLEEMVTTRADEISEETRIESLEQSLANTNSDLQAIPDQQLQLNDLERAVKNASEQLSDVEKRLQDTRIAESLSNRQSNVQVIDEPEQPYSTSLPNIPTYLLFSFAAAFAAGAIAWYIMFHTDPRVRNLTEVNKLLPLPVEAWFRTRNGNPLQEMSVSMDRLRHALNGWRTGGNKSVLMISADSNSDRELVSIGLAQSFVRAGMRVALVDLNFTSPQISSILNVAPLPGLVQYFDSSDGKMDLATITREIGNRNFIFLPAGVTHPAQIPGSVLDSPMFRNLVSELEKVVDVVLYDVAPIAETVDGLTLLKPGVKPVVVVKVGKTRKKTLKVLAAQFKHLPVANAAMVLVNADDINHMEVVPSALPMQAPVQAGSGSTTADW